jgi:hypothetical protein
VGGRCISPAYLDPGVCLVPLDLGTIYGADAEEGERGSPLVRWVSGSGTPGSFCLASRLLRASSACGSCALALVGYRGRPLCCHGLSLILEFAYSVEFGHRSCSLWIRLESLTGGSCLSSLWWDDGSVQYPAFLPHIHQVRGDPSGEVPLPGPLTRPGTIDGDGDGLFSDRCSLGSGAVWMFCLASGGLSGVFWVPFERRVPFGAPLGSLWAPFGAWAPLAPVWGPRAASAFSHS